jgi:acyl carrier protein
MTDTQKKVIAIVAQQMGLSADEVTRESTVESLCIDSLDAMEIVMELEEEFEISIPDEDAQKWANVGDMIDYVEKLLPMRA